MDLLTTRPYFLECCVAHTAIYTFDAVGTNSHATTRAKSAVEPAHSIAKTKVC